jgi:hypothetical protein
MNDELKKILVDNNLEDCIPKFEKNKISDFDIISELTESDLEKIGISALGDRKKILKLFSHDSGKLNIMQNPINNSPQEVLIHHATMKGDDASTGFGKGFGETVGKKAGGCAWSIGIIVIIVIVIAIIIGSM